MSDGQGSVTGLLHNLKGGDAAAAQALWDRYFTRLVRIANAKLASARRLGVVEDGEDAALSAFGSLFDGVKGGKFPQMVDRDDLWRMLVVITARKSIDQIERAKAEKRGEGRVVGESALGAAEPGRSSPLDNVPSAEPGPEFAAMVLEECHRLLSALPDDANRLREIAVWKMEGHTKAEIGEKLNCSTRTVGYRLEYIRAIWERVER